MQPADIARLVAPGDPRVSPDGRRVAFVVTRVDLEADRYRRAIWLVDADGDTPARALTAGDGDANPAWSPDGRRLAFTRSTPGPDPRHRLVLLPVDGPGEPVTLVERDESIGELAWSPDGGAIAFTSRERRPDALPFTPGSDPASQPRRIDRLFPKLDGEGWIVDRPRALFVVATDSPAPARPVAHHRHDVTGPAWSPDGRSLVVSTVRDEPDADLTQVAALHVVDPAGGDLRPLPGPIGPVSLSHPSFSPDGSRIAAVAEDVVLVPSFGRVVVLPAGGGEPTVVTGDLDRQAAPFVGVRPPIWHDEHLVFAVEDHGTQPLYRVPAAGGTPEPLLGGTRAIVGYDEAGGTLAVVSTSPTERPELSVIRDGRETRRTALSAAFHRDLPLGTPEHLRVPSSGGGEVDAWLLRPATSALAGADERVPLLLSVHGGPMTQYPTAWFDEFALWSSAGYAVLWCNPHGSTGDTEEFLRSIRPPESPEAPGTGWGGVDADDVLAALDAALAHDASLDPARVGLLGGSYGGFMTTWLVGHSDRFAAACSERAANNVLSLEWGGSDAAGYFRFEMGGLTHLEAPEMYRRLSPTSYVEGIHTPMLILHSENDLRCPPEQADQLYLALRLLGREVEYWRFPDEGHELSRSGSPRHRVQRAEIILDFFGRMLRPA